eukprot:15219152-Heterocapsa_arctica.AAC.1
MAVPVTGLPEPEVSERDRLLMANALVNGKRKQSTESEFKRSVKNCLNYRLKWDNFLIDEEKTQRAYDGCSRFHAGQHFP